jgi:phosphate transport system permease protein
MKKSSAFLSRNTLFEVTVCSLAVVALIPFVWMIVELVFNGLKYIRLDLFLQNSPTSIDVMLAEMGRESIPGGILDGICGSFLIVMMAVVIAVPLGIFAGVGIHLNKHRKWAVAVDYLSGLIQGMPTVLIGVIVYLSIEIPFNSYSLFAGGITLAIILFPLIIEAAKKTIKTLPDNLIEAGLALGGSYTNVMLKVIFPASRRQLLAEILVAVSKIIGETAPLIIILLGISKVNWNIFESSSTITLLIWEFFNSSMMIHLVWSASLVLFLIVFVLNIVARRLTTHGQ